MIFVLFLILFCFLNFNVRKEIFDSQLISQQLDKSWTHDDVIVFCLFVVHNKLRSIVMILSRY